LTKFSLTPNKLFILAWSRQLSWWAKRHWRNSNGRFKVQTPKTKICQLTIKNYFYFIDLIKLCIFTF